MNPLQLPSVFQLLRAKRITHKNVRVQQFLWQVVVIRQMHYLHFRPAFSEGVRDYRLWPPPSEGMPHANHQLRFSRLCAQQGILVSQVGVNANYYDNEKK